MSENQGLSRRTRQWQGRKQSQQGFTFIEALIAFSILATSIVGVVAMQAQSKKGSFDAVQRTLAVSFANDIIQRMRVNVPAVTNGSYSNTYTAFTVNNQVNRCRSASNPCSSAQIALNDLYEWKMAVFGADVTQSTGNVGGLISPIACISHAAGLVSVVIAWHGRTQTTDAATSKAANSLATGCGTAGTDRRQVYMDTFIY